MRLDACREGLSGLTEEEEDMGLFSSSSELSAREDSSHSLMSFLMVPCCWSRYMRDTSCTIVMFHRCCKTGQCEG